MGNEEERNEKIKECIKQHPELGKNAIAKYLHMSAQWVRNAINAHPEWGYSHKRKYASPRYTEDQLKKLRELAAEHKGEWTQRMYAAACGMTYAQVQGAVRSGRVPEYVPADPNGAKKWLASPVYRKKRKEKKEAKPETVSEIARIAKERGMSYGQYVHMCKNAGRTNL